MPELVFNCAIAAFLLFLGIFASKVSSLVKVPTLLLFLVFGMLVRDWSGISPGSYETVCQIGILALAFILYSGGYDTSWDDVKKVLAPGSILATLGVFLTALFIGLFAARMLKWDYKYGMLLGAVVSSTDAAAVFAIFRSKSIGLSGKLRPLLEFESGSNDPMATFLTLFVISMISEPGGSLGLLIPAFLINIGVGVCIGLTLGFALTKLINRVKLDYDGLYYVIGIATVLLAYSLSELCKGNGFMAVYVCGLVMGNSRFLYKHGLGRFHDGIAWLMQVTLFLVLGLLVTPKILWGTALYGVILSIFIMLIARPLSVYLCMLWSEFSWKERTFVALGGIRGAAPIVLALFPCFKLHSMGEEAHAETIFHIVFVIVLFSVYIQGKGIMPVARFLGLDEVAKSKQRAPLEFEETGLSKSRPYEFDIRPGADVAEKAIRDLSLPETVLVYLIRRKGCFIVPRGNTVIYENDELMVMMDPEKLEEVEKLLYHDTAKEVSQGT